MQKTRCSEADHLVHFSHSLPQRQTLAGLFRCVRRLLTVGVRGSAAGVDLLTEFGDTDPSCPGIWAVISESSGREGRYLGRRSATFADLTKPTQFLVRC